eukprot:XP_014769789.1 PREDICTED: uncharacterized protein LOC106868859 isoform X1 [Octopus bimaculoides]
MCESIGHDIVPNGTIYLGESVTLYITVPNMKRPVVWKSLNYKYECDRTCADGVDYKVTQTGNISTLWIRNVSWKFSTWIFYDDNLHYAQINLDINVKPKIEIKQTSCEYKVMALCSLPPTHIECLYDKKHLKFTDTVKSNCSDGKTISNVGTLKFSKFSGNVNCSFTLAKIFSEYRMLQIECEGPDPWICPTTIVLLCVSVLFIIMTIAVIIWCQKNGNGEDSVPRICLTAIVLLSVSVLLFILMIIVIIFKCIKGKESLSGSQTPAIVLLVTVLISLIIAGFCLLKNIIHLKIQKTGNEKKRLIRK